MTHEQYIELETAQLAKQAGFDWKITSRYAERVPIGNEKPPQFLLLTTEDWGHQDWNSYSKYEPDLCSAPTQAVLQRWLREKYNVHITIEYTSKCQGSIDSYHVWYWRYSDKGIKVFGSYLDDGNKCIKFPTYEAALEAGLKHCLTLILEEKK